MWRPLPKRYEISENRFRELYYYTLQYPEWVKELQKKDSQKKELQKRIEQIEEVCNEASQELSSFIKIGVTQKGMTYAALKSRYEIPCDRNTYYKYRRKFYWLLDKKK